MDITTAIVLGGSVVCVLLLAFRAVVLYNHVRIFEVVTTTPGMESKVCYEVAHFNGLWFAKEYKRTTFIWEWCWTTFVPREFATEGEAAQYLRIKYGKPEKQSREQRIARKYFTGNVDQVPKE